MCFGLSPTLEKVGGKGQRKLKGVSKAGLNRCIFDKTAHEKKPTKLRHFQVKYFILVKTMICFFFILEEVFTNKQKKKVVETKTSKAFTNPVKTEVCGGLEVTAANQDNE